MKHQRFLHTYIGISLLTAIAANLAAVLTDNGVMADNIPTLKLGAGILIGAGLPASVAAILYIAEQQTVTNWAGWARIALMATAGLTAGAISIYDAAEITGLWFQSTPLLKWGVAIQPDVHTAIGLLALAEIRWTKNATNTPTKPVSARPVKARTNSDPAKPEPTTTSEAGDVAGAPKPTTSKPPASGPAERIKWLTTHRADNIRAHISDPTGSTLKTEIVDKYGISKSSAQRDIKAAHEQLPTPLKVVNQ